MLNITEVEFILPGGDIYHWKPEYLEAQWNPGFDIGFISGID